MFEKRKQIAQFKKTNVKLKVVEKFIQLHNKYVTHMGYDTISKRYSVQSTAMDVYGDNVIAVCAVLEAKGIPQELDDTYDKLMDIFHRIVIPASDYEENKHLNSILQKDFEFLNELDKKIKEQMREKLPSVDNSMDKMIQLSKHMNETEKKFKEDISDWVQLKQNYASKMHSIPKNSHPINEID